MASSWHPLQVQRRCYWVVWLQYCSQEATAPPCGDSTYSISSLNLEECTEKRLSRILTGSGDSYSRGSGPELSNDITQGGKTDNLFFFQANTLGPACFWLHELILMFC